MTTAVRASSYSNVVDIDETSSLLFNGMTMCMDLVPNELALALDSNALVPVDGEEEAYLLQRGHLTKLTPEQERTKFVKTVRHIAAKVEKATEEACRADITFVLTYNCNLRCTYCFQETLSKKVRSRYMTAQFVDDFFAHGYPRLFPKPPRSALFTLFGGEPLLPHNRDAILRILAHAEQTPACKLNLSTNGLYLPRMLGLVGPEKGRIDSVQITLDGDASFHNQNRIPKSGKPTFDQMNDAILRVIDTGATATIRVHLHPDQLKSTEALVGHLDREGLLSHPRVYVYFAPLNEFTSDQLAGEELETFRRTFQFVAKRTGRPPHNRRFIEGFLKMQGKKELPSMRYCGLGTDSIFTIDPSGGIYQCYDEAGDADRIVGTFANGAIEFVGLKQEYAQRTLLNIPECLDCSLALFCGGGCPMRARKCGGSIFKPFCHQSKEFIHQTLKAYYLLNAAATLVDRAAQGVTS